MRELDAGPQHSELVGFLFAPDTKAALDSAHAEFLLKHTRADYLDVGFFSKGADRNLTPVTLYGVEHIVGLVIRADNEGDDVFTARSAMARERLAHDFPGHPDWVVISGGTDILSRLADGSYAAAIRDAAEEEPQQTGGDWGTLFEHERVVDGDYLGQHFSELLRQSDNAAWLRDLGIRRASRGRLAHLFVDRERGADGLAGAVRLVNLRNVRIGAGLSGPDTFSERVVPEAMCAGVFVPDIPSLTREILDDTPQLSGDPDGLRSEIKRRSYRTAEYIRRSLVPLMDGNGSDTPAFHIAVALDGQLNLWEGMGLFADIPPYREGAVPLKQIIDALFTDGEGRFGGTLADMGIRYRTRGVMVEGLDLMFVRKDDQGIRRPAPVTLWGYGKGGEELMPYENVVGLVAVEEDLPTGERKKAVRIVNNLVRYWLNDPDVQVMNVDSGLVAAWKRMGSAVVSPEDKSQALEAMTPAKRFDYGFGPGGGVNGVSLTLFENQQQIGGNKLFLNLTYPDRVRRSVAMDFGWSYPDEPTLSSFPNRASYKLGLNPYLEAGILPRVRRLYATHLLVQSLNYDSLAAASAGQYSFIASELFHRLGETAFRELVRERVPTYTNENGLYRHLAEMEERYYADKTVFDAALFSHAHTDHTGAAFAIRDEVPFGLSSATEAFLHATYRKGWHYTAQEAIIRKKREDGKEGGSYPTFHRPLIRFADGQVVRVSPDASALAKSVDHSIFGAMGFMVTVTDALKSPIARVAYMGDFRKGAWTDAAFGAFKDADILVVEGTNVNADKPSVGVTEERVGANIAILKKRADDRQGLFVVQMDPNNIERLSAVVDASEGRRVLVPFPVAQVLHEFAILNEGLPLEQQIRVPELGRNIGIIKQEKMVYDPWEEQLERSYGAVRIDEIVADPAAYTVVALPQRLLATLFGSLSGTRMAGVVVRSTYWPYGAADKQIVLSNRRWCREHGIEYAADIDLSGAQVRLPKDPMGLHASGHATEPELLEYVTGLASWGNLRLVVPLHTETRGLFADKLDRELKSRGLLPDHVADAVRTVRKIGKRGVDIQLYPPR